MVDAAYEDPAEWILKEADLPDNVTPAELQARRTPRSATASPGSSTAA